MRGERQTITERKRALRTELKARRAALDPYARERADASIARNVRSTCAWQAARTVFAYLSFGTEVDTRWLVQAAWGADKVVALPWCVPHTRHMRWFIVDSLDGLVRSALGVEEPVPDPQRELQPTGMTDAVALVPGLAFDRQGFRLGYGGGFYDGFLTGFRGTTLGLCRKGFLVDDLGACGVLESHDCSVGMVVTEVERLAAGLSGGMADSC